MASSYQNSIDYIYSHKDITKRFAPTPYCCFHSLRTREFLSNGFNEGFAPTLTARDYKDPKCVIVEQNEFGSSTPVDYRNRVATVIGGLGEKKSNKNTQYYQQDRIYDGRKTVAVCLSSTLSNGSNMYLFEEDVKVKSYVVAMRGRNPNNPTSRVKAEQYVQRLELNRNNVCNTLTTVDKDNYILEVC